MPSASPGAFTAIVRNSKPSADALCAELDEWTSELAATAHAQSPSTRARIRFLVNASRALQAEHGTSDIDRTEIANKAPKPAERAPSQNGAGPLPFEHDGAEHAEG